MLRDYYDALLPKEFLISRLENHDSDIEINEYRYTLIIGVNCYDFIIREKKVMLISESTSFLVKKLSEERFLFKAVSEETFTHFIARVKPYLDTSNLCKRLGVMYLILQDLGKEHEVNSNDKTPPKYDMSAKIYRNPILSDIGFNDSILSGEVISNIIKYS